MTITPIDIARFQAAYEQGLYYAKIARSAVPARLEASFGVRFRSIARPNNRKKVPNLAAEFFAKTILN